MTEQPHELPPTFRDFVERFPDVEAARAAIARTVEDAGPLDRRTCQLIRLGIAVGAGFGTAARSHARRALETGATDAEIEQALFLGVNMIGLPKTIMAWQAVRDATPAPPTTTS